MTRRLLAVSPHLDDAAFSVGSLLAAKVRDGWSVAVLTCFTGNVDRPRGFALACQLDKGLGDHVDHHVVRDALAVAAAGSELLLWEDWPYIERSGPPPPNLSKVMSWTTGCVSTGWRCAKLTVRRLDISSAPAPSWPPASRRSVASGCIVLPLSSDGR